ncbi:MAG: hypothetical protein ABFS18_02015 [Thermodesulfobacteriota bacterium]
MENTAKKTNNTLVALDERLAEAFSLACDLAEPLLENGNSEALGKLRRLKALLATALRPVGAKQERGAQDSPEGPVADYRREALALLRELGSKLLRRDADAVMDDVELEAISLQAETAVDRINCYFNAKIRGSLQDIVAGGIHGQQGT